MHFSEESNNSISRHRQIVYSIVSGYPSGIGDSELKNEYLKILQQFSLPDAAVANLSSVLYDLKGTLIDFRTVNGIRIFSVLRKKIPFTSIHPLIEKLGNDSFIFAVRPISFIDCKSFCVYLVTEERECCRFTQDLHDKCKNGTYKLLSVETWMVNIGDCYVVHCKKLNFYLRVKVIKLMKEEKTALCFLVDLGSYNRYRIKDLHIVPDIYIYSHYNLKTSKIFLHPVYAIRCCLDINQELYNGFPTSRTGLQMALCGVSECKNTVLKVQFLSYDQDVEAFVVNVFAEDERISKLEDAVKKDSTLLEKDLFYSMSVDGDFDTNLIEKDCDSNKHFERFVKSCEEIFANLKVQ